MTVQRASHKGGDVTFYRYMASSRRASTLNVWLALGTVYVVWGSTYLAIAIAVAPIATTSEVRNP